MLELGRFTRPCLIRCGTFVGVAVDPKRLAVGTAQVALRAIGQADVADMVGDMVGIPRRTPEFVAYERFLEDVETSIVTLRQGAVASHPSESDEVDAALEQVRLRFQILLAEAESVVSLAHLQPDEFRALVQSESAGERAQLGGIGRQVYEDALSYVTNAFSEFAPSLSQFVPAMLTVIAEGVAGVQGGVGRLEANAARIEGKLDSVVSGTTERASAPRRALAEHETYATSVVHSSLGLPQAGEPAFRFEFTERRSQLAEQFRRVGDNKNSLLVTGPSGVGKSALVFEVLESLRTEPDFDAVVLNFRELPDTSFAFEALLGRPLSDLLDEFSAPRRLLIIDAADAAVERSSAMLTDLATAARRCGVGLIAVSSDTAADLVSDQVARGSGATPETYQVPVLSDDELSEVSTHLPALRGVLRNPGSASLLRRLLVLDLIARTGRTLNEPLSEWECLDVIWNGLVRGRGHAGAASPEARERTMLAVAAAHLDSAAAMETPPATAATQVALLAPLLQTDHAAVDSLRHDHLLAPPSLRRPRLEFAHDEIRRYATAILFSRADSIASSLKLSQAPRWSLSAAILACKGQLLDSQLSPESSFTELLADFSALAREFGPRWADVPLEAVLDTPHAYRCLAASQPINSAEGSTSTEEGRQEPAAAGLALADMLRVVQQRATSGGFVDVALGAPVIDLLLDHAKPWEISDSAFDVLSSWLTAHAVGGAPAGQPARLRLRTKLVAFWALHPPNEPDAEEPNLVSTFGGRSRRRRLDHEVTNEKYVETLALLGLDTNEEVEHCLRTLASRAPAFLAPAVDAPFSARSIASYDVNLLADLIEAYYIDNTTGQRWRMHDAGIRIHQGRWTSFGPPYDAYWFGGFWVLFNRAPAPLSARVLNRVLNHAASARADRQTRRAQEERWAESGNGDELESQAQTSSETDSSSAPAAVSTHFEDEHMLSLGQATVIYRGDAQMWGWYRGSSVGPHPCLSALQAMERVAESWLLAGSTAEAVIETLLHECENVAVPGMLFGLLTRNLEDVGSTIDPFLVEPFVWHAEIARRTAEYFGWKANSEGLAHPERREWTPRETAMMLVLQADEPRREELRSLAQKLIENGRSQGLEEAARNWATCLDATYFKGQKTDEGFQITVEPPEDVRAAQERYASAAETHNEFLRLQNTYWPDPKPYKPGYMPPTDEQVAVDLAVAQGLIENDAGQDELGPYEAIASVARTAILRAADGHPEALGDHADFAVEVILEIAAFFLDGPDQEDDGQFYDLGIDRSAATALPALLSPVFDQTLRTAGIDAPELVRLGDAVASRSSLETRLFLARGCDRVWTQTCRQFDLPTASTSAPACLHAVAFTWLVNSARDAEIGPWELESQRRDNVHISGDLAERLESLEGTEVDIEALDAAIRGLGSAASHQHCRTEPAAHLLARMLDAQARAMVAHEAEGYTGDDRGHHTLAAARALLQTVDPTSPDALLAYLDALRADAGLLANFLQGLAAAGTETTGLAATVRATWPAVMERVLGYAEDSPIVFNDHTSGKWVASALLPEPLTWAQGIRNEPAAAPIDWVVAEELIPFVEPWLHVARGQSWCLNALIRFIGRRPRPAHVAPGLKWVETLCLRDGRILISGTAMSDEWLISIRQIAEQQGYLERWQSLVDTMVVAGNSMLAPYST
jgi:hypothetical protein